MTLIQTTSLLVLFLLVSRSVDAFTLRQHLGGGGSPSRSFAGGRLTTPESRPRPVLPKGLYRLNEKDGGKPVPGFTKKGTGNRNVLNGFSTPDAVKTQRMRRSQLFSSSDGEGEVTEGTKQQKWQNLRILGKLSFSGLLAYGYMRYYAVMSLGSAGYYLYQKTVSS